MTSPPKDLYQSGPSTSDQFIRRWALTLNGPSGQVWSVSDSNAGKGLSGPPVIQEALRIQFQTRQAQNHVQGTAKITVYNLPLDKLRQLVSQYNKVILQAGYQSGQYGVIFIGYIAWFRIGRAETFTETFLELHCQDGMLGMSYSTVNGSVAAGTTQEQATHSLIKNMQPFGITEGKVLGMSTTPYIRGKVQFGQTLDELKTHGNVNVENGVINVHKPTTPYPAGDAVLINSSTGLIGMAEATQSAVEFTVNLNPRIGVNTTVQIDQRNINQAGTGPPPAGTEASGAPAGAIQVQNPDLSPGWFADVSADGKYTVWVVEHNGDSRGNQWETHVSAYALGAVPLQGNLTNYPIPFDTKPTDGQLGTAAAAPDIPTDPAGGVTPL